MSEASMTFSIHQAKSKRRKALDVAENQEQVKLVASETFSIPASSLVRRPEKKIKLKLDPKKLQASQEA